MTKEQSPIFNTIKKWFPALTIAQQEEVWEAIADEYDKAYEEGWEDCKDVLLIKTKQILEDL